MKRRWGGRDGGWWGGGAGRRSRGCGEQDHGLFAGVDAHGGTVSAVVLGERGQALERREGTARSDGGIEGLEQLVACLLYTSDAAAEPLCVDLGGRRILKKKNTQRSLY